MEHAGIGAALALTPILVILVLMLGMGWSAARAGVLGVVAAFAVAVLAFEFPGPLALALGPALGGLVAEAGFTAVTILWIIGPALGIHQLQLRTGAADVLRSALGAFAPDPRILALLIAWFFVLFMEGAAGFGSSVALAAPFLVAAGFLPAEAVTITLVGHVVGVSFGAIGTPVVPQVSATGLSGQEIARATGIYHSVLGWLPLLVMLRIVRRSSRSKEERPIRGWIAAAFLCFAVPYTLLWMFVGPELPTLAGALFGGIAFILLIHRFWRAPSEDPLPRGGAPATDVARPSLGIVARAAAPYLVLVALVLATRLIPLLGDPLRDVEIAWSLHEIFGGAMQPFYHPGSMLLLGFLVGAVVQRAPREAITGAFVDATRRLLPVAMALTAMLLLARTMVHSGMTEVLADAAAAGAGGMWPFFAPFVGVLGTFVTGSATASNILFTDFQRETALALSLPIAGVVGIQGFGAAVGNMICPHNVVAAGATVGLEGREGEILRKTIVVAIGYAAVGGFLALWLV